MKALPGSVSRAFARRRYESVRATYLVVNTLAGRLWYRRPGVQEHYVALSDLYSAACQRRDEAVRHRPVPPPRGLGVRGLRVVSYGRPAPGTFPAQQLELFGLDSEAA